MTARARTAPVLAALLLLAVNLRPAAVSVGPVLDDVRRGLDLSGPEAGLLTSLPVFAFALFGAAAPASARRIGPHRVTLLALVAVATGLFSRALVSDAVSFLALSMLALAGMAMASVLLPSLVLHFPERIGAVTALYTTTLAVGLTAAFVVTVPLSDALGGWRAGLAAWGVVALVGAVPWLRMAREDRHPEAQPTEPTEPTEPTGPTGPTGPHRATGPIPDARVRFGDVARTRLGWAMAAFFGLQSLQAYAVFGWFATLWRDAGFGATTAGALLGVVAGMSIPLSLWAPRVVARPGDQRRVLVLVIVCYPAAYLALAFAPHALALPAALVLGVAMATFPIVLVLIGLRSRTPEATAALSAFTQALGYLMAAVGPFGVGVLHDASGGWTLPLLVLAALSVPLLALGLYVGRPAVLEDELPRGPLDVPRDHQRGA